MTPDLAGYYLPSDPTVLPVAERQRELQAAGRSARLLNSRRPRWVVPFHTLIALVIGVAALMSARSISPASAMSGDAFADAHGLYDLGSGELLTLYGRHPMFELAGEEVHLVADGADRYVADAAPFEVITLNRDSQGMVTAITFERPGRGRQIGNRIDPYSEREVAFANPGADLAGTLLLPAGDGPHPAVAIVHGAGIGTRETYRLMASHLAREGVAALIYDKRGTGQSSGSFAAATFDDLTDDALAAVSLLRSEPRIDPERVGLAGMSQGGWIIARAATRSDDVAFLVALSPSGYAPAEAADWLTGSMLAVRGFNQSTIDASGRLWGMMYSSLDLIEAGLMEPMPSVPGFWFHALDPRLETMSLWEQVRQPVLGLWGELDCQVPADDSLAAIRGALERGPNRLHELRILAEADHGLALVGACAREIGFSHGGRHRYADGALTTPAEWIGSLPTKAEGGTVVLPDEHTPSALGWHQSTSAGVPWYGSLLPQLAALLMLLISFGSSGLAWVVRTVLASIRPPRERRPISAHLWGSAGLAGVAATLVGILALVELLSLGGIMSAPFIGGPTVDGATLLYAGAGIMVAATIAIGAAAAFVSARVGNLGSLGSVVGGFSLALLAAWAGYWGFIPLPSFG